MPTLNVSMREDLMRKVKKHAKEPIFNGNHSAVVRAALIFFFAKRRKHTYTPQDTTDQTTTQGQ